MQLRGQLMQFLSSGFSHQTAQVKMKILQYWHLITSGKGKGEIHKGCLEQEQVELSLFSSYPAGERCGVIVILCLCAAASAGKDSCYSHSSTTPESSAESCCCLDGLPACFILSCWCFHAAGKERSCLTLQQLWEGLAGSSPEHHEPNTRYSNPNAFEPQAEVTLEGQDPNPDLQLGFTVVGDVFFEFSVSVPVAFQKQQISAAFCQIWFFPGVRYPWTTLSPVPLSFSLTILYLSDFHLLFLYQFQQLSLLYAQCQVLPTPPCLNNSMPSDLFSNSSSEPMMPETSDPGLEIHFSPAVSTHRHSQGAHLPFWS